MGLCKCERKKFTNLFCFEHRVNVCEFCLMSDHAKCIVKSYLCWLKDSDYSSVCLICSQELNDPISSECVRLMCLDIFHWDCLDRYASELPATTAPAGYECPACSQSIIPLSNQGGPLAETLRSRLSSATWMKPNLQSKNVSSRNKGRIFNSPQKSTLEDFGDGKLLDSSLDAYAERFLRGDDTSFVQVSQNKSDVVVSMDPVISATHTQVTEFANASETSELEIKRPATSDWSNYHDPSRDYDDSTVKVPSLLSSQRLITDDEDKYKRRSPFSKFGSQFQLFKTSPINMKSFRRHRILWIVTGIILFFFVVLILSSLTAVPEAVGGPLLDPMLNPEIHVESPVKIQAGNHLQGDPQLVPPI